MERRVRFWKFLSSTRVVFLQIMALALFCYDNRWPFSSYPRGDSEIWIDLLIQVGLTGVAILAVGFVLEKIHPKRVSAMRIHLSTLVILSLTAGALLWANTSPHYTYVDQVAVPYYFNRGYGWPFLAYRTVHSIYEKTAPEIEWIKNAMVALLILNTVRLVCEGLAARKQETVPRA